MTKKILYVYAPAGPPLNYLLPKMAKRGEIYTYIVNPPSIYNKSILEKYSTVLEDYTHLKPELALQEILTKAQSIKPDAIITFSEFLLNPVSELASQLGLRGVGKNVQLARNKILMRERWKQAHIPQPKFILIRNPSDLKQVHSLDLPFIIKLAYGAGSIGQQIVSDLSELKVCVERLLQATEAARKAGKHEFYENSGFPQIIAEEIIQSTTESWYEEAGYGDYLSVEGLVRDGVYYPLAMTGRLRTIPPFTELGNLAPCILDKEKKQRIVRLITSAVNALQFENCATHTEIKLMADGQVSFLETAARMGGVAIAKELDEVFGIDYVDLFLSVILGEYCEIPAFEANPARCAAGSIALIGCNSLGVPWSNACTFDPAVIDWNKLTNGQAKVEIEFSQSISVGADFPIYDGAGGVLNYAGQAFLVSPESASLKSAAYKLLDELESFMPKCRVIA